MANEFKHKDPGTELTQAEFIAACGDGHIFACQATGDIVYASSATVLSKLARGAANTGLSMGGSCIPAWTASPSVTDLTIGGGCITLSAATDIALLDNNASALSFDATGKTGIIDIVTTNCSEGVTMSGTLGVTGVLTATGGLAGGAICIGSNTITTTGLISGGSLDVDDVLINGSTIGHTCDTDLITVADQSVTIAGDLAISGGCITLTGAATDIDLIDNNACALSFDASGQAGILAIDTQNCAEGVKMSGKLTVTGAISTTGALTVGVDDTGHDVKFFGAAAGAYMLYDQSCDQLEIRGASADATTSTGKLLLSTSLTNVNANDVIGSINFQAPAEAGGTDAIAIAAGIRAVAQATFTCAVNATDLIFYTGHSEAATEKFRFTSQGEIGVGGANYGTDGQVLTSGGAGAAAAWEDAGGGGPCQAVESAIECETNQDTYIPPDLAKHIKGAAKWWVDILLAGAKTGTSYNVACVCDNGTGCRIITYTSAMAEANYPVIGMNRGFTNHSSVVFSECNGTASVKIKIRHGESTYGLHDERNMIVGFGLA